jgi:Heavy-metal resistance
LKRWGLIVVLLLSLGINLGLLAQRARHRQEHETRSAAGEPLPTDPRAPGAPKLALRLADRLGLEGAAREAFVAQHLVFFEDMRNHREKVRTARDVLRDNLISTKPDQALAERQLEAVSRAELELERNFIETYFKSRDLLDPEQQRLYQRFLGSLRQPRADPERRLPPRFRRGEGPPPLNDRPGR